MVEVRGQVLREKRIVLCSCHRFLDVIAVSAVGARQGDQRSREFHFWIRPAQTDCLSYPAISVETGRGVGLAFAYPLLVSLGQVADVEPCEGVRASGGIRVRRARLKSRDQLLRRLRVLASVDCGPA